MSTTEKLSQQESFNHGVIAALHALKTGLQATPGFNNEALLHIVRGLLNTPINAVDQESFNAPILALLHDHIIDENGNMTTQEVSRN